MHIRPFHASDFSAIATITAESFFTDQLFDYICPSRSEYPDHFRARFLHELKIKYYAGHHFYVVVTDKSDHDWDGEEQVMGYAAWVLAGGGTSKQQEGKGTVTLGTKIQRFGYGKFIFGRIVPAGRSNVKLCMLLKMFFAILNLHSRIPRLSVFAVSFLQTSRLLSFA